MLDFSIRTSRKSGSVTIGSSATQVAAHAKGKPSLGDRLTDDEQVEMCDNRPGGRNEGKPFLHRGRHTGEWLGLFMLLGMLVLLGGLRCVPVYRCTADRRRYAVHRLDHEAATKVENRKGSLRPLLRRYHEGRDGIEATVARAGDADLVGAAGFPPDRGDDVLLPSLKLVSLRDER
jgi:hypothetical protein